jgi:hypothetical protein
MYPKSVQNLKNTCILKHLVRQQDRILPSTERRKTQRGEKSSAIPAKTDYQIIYSMVTKYTIQLR